MRTMHFRPLKLPEILTKGEREKIFTETDPRTPIGLRNLCILRLMANAGLRVSEALSLEMADIEWVTGKLKVRQGKGKKDRFVWINKDDLNLLIKWREMRFGNNDLLFTTKSGGPVYDVYMRQLMKRLRKKAGINKNIHPHTLRHTFATDLYRKTKDIMLVQKALGHSDISTTMIYTHIVDDELEEAMRNLREYEEVKIHEIAAKS